MLLVVQCWICFVTVWLLFFGFWNKLLDFLYCRPGQCQCRDFWTASFMAGRAAASAWMPRHKRTAPLAQQGETSNRDNRPTPNPSTTTRPGHKKSSRSFEIYATAALRKTASSSKIDFHRIQMDSSIHVHTIPYPAERILELFDVLFFLYFSPDTFFYHNLHRSHAAKRERKHDSLLVHASQILCARVKKAIHCTLMKICSVNVRTFIAVMDNHVNIHQYCFTFSPTAWTVQDRFGFFFCGWSWVYLRDLKWRSPWKYELSASLRSFFLHSMRESMLSL